jgi:arylsulfatase A-like enzyme/Flp pilus assembly protein TadD
VRAAPATDPAPGAAARCGAARRLSLRALASLALIATLAGCTRGPAPAPPARHVVIVTIDTLRADRLGCYGARDVATPRLDRLASLGALALEASAHVPLTRPSHVSLFTGLLPTEHGIRDNVSPALVPKVALLAERFHAAGFATGAFVSSVVLDAQSGLGRGFDAYADRFAGASGDAPFLNTVQKPGEQTIAEALAWLREQQGKRVLLWLHLYEPHDPYEPREPYLSRYAGRPYDGEVAWSDELFGRFEDGIRGLGLGDADTALVVTSDHGEGLGEHDESLHGFFAYQTTLRVPFLVRAPGIPPGRRLERTVRLVDVFPTVLELAGLPPVTEPLAGRSLAAALRGAPEPAEPTTYAETLVPLLQFGWSDLRVIREGRFKYIQAPRPELYDLRDDPGERRDLARDRPQQADAMRNALATVLERERRGRAAEGSRPSDELIERLGALGYVGAGGPAETATPGADPKDKVEEFRVVNSLIREALLAAQAGDHEASVRKLRAVLARGVESFEVHNYLGRSLAALGRHAEAGRHYDEAARRQPAHAAAWIGAADARLRARDSEGALERLRDGQAASPGDVSLRGREARLLRELGRREEARRAYEAALPLAPKDARLRAELGELLRELGLVPEAIARQQEATALDGSVASYWNSLGMTLGGAGRTAEAERAFRRAIELDGRAHRYAYNLGLILQRQGRAAEARPYFEKALALEPGFTPARDRLAETRGSR